MALGIEQNNLAPALIQSSGQALVQGIRQIGQQISGHLIEMQTRRDLGALAQEMQGLDVQSNQFPLQLAELNGRHPLAAKDERAKMMLVPLGAAHAQWQAGEAEARAFHRAMSMQVSRDNATRDLYDYKREKDLETPQNIGGALVIPRDPAGEPKVLYTPPPRVSAGANRPVVAHPGDVLFDPNTHAEVGRGLPKAPSSSDSISRDRLKTSLLTKSASSLQSEINHGHARLDETEKEQRKILEDAAILKTDAAKAAAAARFKELDTKKHGIIQEVNELKKRHLKIQEDLGAIQAGMQDAEGAAILPPLPPDAAGLPAAAAPSFKTPDEVRAAVKSGTLQKAAAADILRKNFGFQ